MAKKTHSKRVTPKSKKQIKVPFPANLTQAEMYLFEKHSGMGLMEIPDLMTSLRGKKMLGLTTLIMISLAREGTRLTIGQILQKNKYVLDMEAFDLEMVSTSPEEFLTEAFDGDAEDSALMDMDGEEE